MQRFLNKVVLITGGTSGIGRKAAEKFLQEGAKVVVTGRDALVGQKVAQDLCSPQNDILFIQADVSLEKDIERQVTETIDKFGKIDVLVTSAGINHIGMLSEASEWAWDMIMDINLKGTFFSIKHAIPFLKKSKGAIVTLGSDVSLRGSSTIPLYSISKAGVSMITELFAAELADSGVRINSVLPANVLPGMKHNLKGNGPQDAQWIVEDSSGPDWVLPPIGRFAKAEEVVNSILFLASEEASYCTGSHVLIDGALNAAQA